MRTSPRRPPERGHPGRTAIILRYVVLGIGALVFLFPFYYMVIGSLQLDPDTTLAGAFPHPSNITLDNYADINERIGLVQGLANSGIFTMGVILVHPGVRRPRGLCPRRCCTGAAAASPSRSCCSCRSCRSSCS